MKMPLSFPTSCLIAACFHIGAIKAEQVGDSASVLHITGSKEARHLNSAALGESNLSTDTSGCNASNEAHDISQRVPIDDSDVSRCLKVQGQLCFRTTSLRLDSPRWAIGNRTDTSLSCAITLVASEDTKLHVAQWRRGPRSNCSQKNYVTLRDSGYSFNASDCGRKFSLYESSASALDVVIVVGEPRSLLSVTLVVQAVSNTFEIKHHTPNAGYVKSRWYKRKTSPRTDSWITISLPLNHVVLTSIPRLERRWFNDFTYERGIARLYKGGNWAKDLVWEASDDLNVPSPDVYVTRMMYLRFTGKISFLWIQLLYSFHEQTHPPSLGNGRLWNCSVHEWPDFQRHFLCNLDTECEGGEDEAECTYSGPCGQGHLTLQGRCYLYARGKNMSWRDSNLECQRRGGYLASLNTISEMKTVMAVLRKRRSNIYVFLGLKPTTHIMPVRYRDTNMWADNTVSYYPFYINRKKNYCGYFNSYAIRQLAMCNVKQRSVQFLCELNFPSPELGGNVRKGFNETHYRVLTSLSPPRNASFPVSVVKCPAGHMTHEFLACDEQSACWLSRHGYVESGNWGVPSRTSCPAPMTSLPAMFTCSSSAQRVPYSVVCDHRHQCADGSDENFCVFPPCSGSSPLQCAVSRQCISLSEVCNGQEDCKGKADEVQCIIKLPKQFLPPPAIVHFKPRVPNKARQATYFMTSLVSGCPETHLQCPHDGYCLPVFIRCNGINDCPGSEDEAGCDSVSCPGFYRCRSSSVCLHPRHVCDGVYQCPQHDDELVCHVPCPESCKCHGLGFTCHRSFPAELHAELRYLDASGSGLTPARLKENILLIHLSLARCGLATLHNMTLPNLRSVDLSHNELSVISAGHLRGMLSLQHLFLSDNPLEAPFASDGQQLTFPAVKTLDLSGVRMKTLSALSSLSPFPGLETLNLSHCGVDHVVGEGLHATNKLKSLDITGCPMTQFPRDLLSELDDLHSVRADNFKVCCAATLPAAFNLANCRAPFDEVSSCESLLRADIYVAFLSMFSTLSLLGNLSSFLNRGVCSKGRRSGFGVFVTHLFVSDFLMGVYLAVIGVADRLYKGSYLWEDVLWRRNAACKVAGFMCLLSNEVSAFIICLITVDRFLVLRFPFSGVHFKARSANVICAMVWTVGMTIAAVPLTPVVSHWAFYSNTGICIPLPVTRRTFAGRHYAFGVLIVFNFILFLLIAVGQAAIYVSIRANTMSTADSTKKSNDLRIARRLITVAVSDFLCWFPVGLLGLLASTGVPVPGEINVGLAILVLPLNSALNPFLYTINVVLERQRRSRDEKMLKFLTEQVWEEEKQVSQHL